MCLLAKYVGFWMVIWIGGYLVWNSNDISHVISPTIQITDYLVHIQMVVWLAIHFGYH